MKFWIFFAIIYIIGVSAQIGFNFKVTKHGDLLNLAPAVGLLRRSRYAEIPQMSFQGIAYDSLLNNVLNTTTEEPTTVSTENVKAKAMASVKGARRRQGKLRRLKTRAPKLN